MKAALKFIMTLSGLILIGIAIGTVLLLTQFEGALRDGLTRKAGQILHADVHLEGVRFDWLEQALVFKGVSVFNPEGFTDREAIRIESLQVRPQLLTIFSRTPVMKEVSLHGAEVHLQYKAEGGTNLGAMMAPMDAGGAAPERTVQGILLQPLDALWNLGRPLKVDVLRSDQVAFHVRDAGAETPELSLVVDAFSVSEPELAEAVSGTRIIQQTLTSLMKHASAANGMPAPVREKLLVEFDAEAAAATSG